LRIAFDAKRAFNNLSGLGNYSRSVIQTISKEITKTNLYLFTPKIHHQFETNKYNTTIVQPNNWTNKYFWRTFGINKKIKDLNIDLYHGLSNEVPYKIKINNVVTIHDLLFLKYPHFYKKIDRKIYQFKSKQSCQDSTKIIATSQSTKSDIVNYFNISPEKIHVIYQSCHSDFINHKQINITNEILELIKRPYLLFVGRIEERKNLILLIQALRKFKEVHLICVGKKTNYFKKVKKSILEAKFQKQITFIDYVDNITLSFLYKNSRGLVYPSIDEGFGIPIIEAMYCSTPVIVSNKKIFKEIGGNYTYYFEQNQEESLTELIKKIWYDSKERDNRITQNLNYVKKFNEKQQATEIITLYKKIINGS
tara:strand:- start:3950 stop:5047 length:1098 start_codon:yes stop_codon:yes gene_type:complete